MLFFLLFTVATGYDVQVREIVKKSLEPVAVGYITSTIAAPSFMSKKNKKWTIRPNNSIVTKRQKVIRKPQEAFKISFKTASNPYKMQKIIALPSVMKNSKCVKSCLCNARCIRSGKPGINCYFYYRWGDKGYKYPLRPSYKRVCLLSEYDKPSTWNRRTLFIPIRISYKMYGYGALPDANRKRKCAARCRYPYCKGYKYKKSVCTLFFT